MTSQPWWDEIKSARISRSGLIGLVAGIILGLALGLLIGWVWWPVEWQGGADSVTVAQAEYISLVADAYQGAGGAPDALAQAQQRLALMGPLSPEDLTAATAYYADQPGASSQVRNLVTLSMALGIPVDVASNPAVADAMRAPEAASLSGGSSAGGSSNATGSAAQQSGGGVNGFALVLLFALLLVAGGAYIYWTMTRKRTATATEQWSDDAAGGFADETEDVSGPPTGSGAVITGFDRSTLQAAPTQPAAASRPAPASTFSPRNYSTVYAPPPVSGPPGFEPEEETFGARTSSTFYPRDEVGRSEGAALAVDPGEDEDTDEDDEVTAPAVTAAAIAAPPRPARPSRYDRYTTIDTYAAAFHAGMANVDFMRNITDESDGRYLGEYGMFVHERSGLLDSDSDKVIAFEVTLIDKAEEHPPLTTVARTLLSEYAHDKLYSQFENERLSGGPPIIAQRDTNFQLEGGQLLLDCTITEVSYTAEGVFRSLTLDMVLKRRPA